MLNRRPDDTKRTMWPYFPELLSRPVPRYTSYPTAMEFHERIGAEEQARAIVTIDTLASLYLHIPFCEQICWYCGCNTGAANKVQRLNAYIDALGHEVDHVSTLTPRGTQIGRIAFGGGSPNAIAPLTFVRLLDRVMTAFSVGAADISVEIDPRGLTGEWVRVLGATGVTHVSMGVQTMAPKIQARIGRIQPQQLIADSTANLRGTGIGSINFDLMYGLPGQTMDDLTSTLDATLAMAPDRIALFGYAHVPHMLPRQRRIDASALPDQAMRFAMAQSGFQQLTKAGYVPVGFDHFALPHDGLARAAQGGTLRRNFQGFTEDAAPILLGMGASAISNFPDLIVQNAKNAGQYRSLVEQGQLAGERGVIRDDDTQARGQVIEDILCGRPADINAMLDDVAVGAALDPFIADGLVVLKGGRLSLTDEARPYARSVAALFDAWRSGSAKTFSSAI